MITPIKYLYAIYDYAGNLLTNSRGVYLVYKTFTNAQKKAERLRSGRIANVGYRCTPCQIVVLKPSDSFEYPLKDA